ncbi:MAG: DUF4864 domain-containing protein [Pseudomonadota bacterium]
MQPRLNPINTRFLWTLTIVAAMLAIMIGSVRAQVVDAEIETTTQSVIADQLDAFQTRDYDRAFSHAAPTIRQIFKNTNNFIQMVKNGYSVLYNPDAYVFGRNFNMDGTIHQEVIATDVKGRQWQAVYTLRQQPDGSWKITGVKMNPYTGAAT